MTTVSGSLLHINETCDLGNANFCSYTCIYRHVHVHLCMYYIQNTVKPERRDQTAAYI